MLIKRCTVVSHNDNNSAERCTEVTLRETVKRCIMRQKIVHYFRLKVKVCYQVRKQFIREAMQYESEFL